VKVTATLLPEVRLIDPDLHGDARGFFLETWHESRYAAAGLSARFVQDNLSRSVAGTLRGLHYQLRRPQGKLVQVVTGAVFDVAVDLRRSSPTFGRWVAEVLSEENRRQMWVPEGFAHGFLVLSQTAEVAYKCTEFYDAEEDRAVRWNDPELGIAWPLPDGASPILSAKDAAAPLLSAAETYP
jgi:dTDP-4-dehydrorhamnose 3,5-epimerase